MNSSLVALCFGASSVVIGALLVFVPEFLLTPPEVVRDNPGGSELWTFPRGVSVLGLVVFCGGMLLLGAVLNRLRVPADAPVREEAPRGVLPA